MVSSIRVEASRSVAESNTLPLEDQADLVMAAILNTLKRFGKNSYTGMLVAHEQPGGWTTETRLFRFSEVGGKSTAFIVTKDALESFLQLLQLRETSEVCRGGHQGQPQ